MRRNKKKKQDREEKKNIRCLEHKKGKIMENKEGVKRIKKKTRSNEGI